MNPELTELEEKYLKAIETLRSLRLSYTTKLLPDIEAYVNCLKLEIDTMNLLSLPTVD